MPVEQMYAIELVAATPPQETTTQVTREAAPPVVKATEEARVLKPTPKSPPKTPPVKVEKPVESPPKLTSTTSTVQPLPGQEARGGQNILNVSIPGFESRHAAYLRNVVEQLMKRFGTQVRPGNPVATVRFRIQADGSASEIRMEHPSRSPAFNLDALAAVEAVGRQKLFGALPEELDQLEISFTFTPGTPGKN